MQRVEDCEQELQEVKELLAAVPSPNPEQLQHLQKMQVILSERLNILLQLLLKEARARVAGVLVQTISAVFQ